MDYTVLYPPERYRCISCNNSKIGFIINRTDYAKIFQINNGLAKISELTDPKNYKKYPLWQCKSCYEVGVYYFEK